MIRNFNSRAALAVAGIVSATAAVGLISTPAYAASSVAGKDGWDKSRNCDANVVVSDATSSGKIEVYGGFVCPTGTGIINEPQVATIRIIMFRNGDQILQSKKNVTMGKKPFSIASDSHAITYPDYSSSDNFYGVMEITSLSGYVRLTTGIITS
ncbi:hypothetical protein AB0C19_24405 [Micromonospora sp. NPDC048842]|uniref:hypothetical protein n=1 Tax=Micromonospora sp. NPDC048842 TaxID=3154346 RepID=UPI0033DC4D34